MTETHKGRCHCGAATLRFTGKSESTFFCHCQDCQRTTGSPFSVELMVTRDGFASAGDLSTYTVSGDSGQGVHRRSCAKCGSGLFLECDADPDYVFVKAGALDDATLVEPEMHIFVSAKQPWVKIADGLPQFERMPPE
ncbi:MAG: GFA family protein [Paracoccaceae bacterium]